LVDAGKHYTHNPDLNIIQTFETKSHEFVTQTIRRFTMSKIRFATLVVAMIMLISVIGASAQDDKFIFGFSQAHNGHPWRVDQTADVRDFWAENLTDEADMIFTDGRNRPDKQTADVEDLIVREVDVLIITPVTAEAMTPVVERAMDEGIAVITLDREVNTEVTLHIGADNVQIGEMAAEYIGQLLNGEGRIIEIQGTLGASATIDRHDAFVAYLEEHYPEIEIIESQTADYSREPALRLMEDLLQRFEPGDFDVVYAHNDEMALGAIEALKDADRLDGVFVVGIDGQNEAFDAIKTGEMTATFTYPNGGAEGVEYAYKIMMGEEVPSVLVLPSAQVDATNIDEWVDKGF
jgi:ribose transport system substrate-binding protein